jgi:hypothetical protein
MKSAKSVLVAAAALTLIGLTACMQEESSTTSPVKGVEQPSVEISAPANNIPDPLEGVKWNGSEPEREQKGYLYGRTPITYHVINGKLVFDGDIILSPEQVTDAPTAGKSSGAARSESQYYWPNRIVYYSIDPNLVSQSRVTDAIKHWSFRFSFVMRTSESNYIYFTDENDGCHSSIGMVGGKQKLYLDNDCTTGNAIHEMGHALGLFHEQSRSDRDTYITVNWNNILSGKSGNFNTYVESGDAGFDYLPIDFNSIMMYDSYSFTKNDLPTMTRKDGTTWIRQRKGLSGGDIATIDKMYPAALCQWVNPLARSSHQVDVFTATPAGQIRTSAWDPNIDAAGVYRGWWNVANGNIQVAGQVTAVARASTKLDVFTVNESGKVYTAAWDQNVDGGNGFRGWWQVGTLTALPGTRVTAMVMASNKIQIFVVDTKGRIQTSYWDGNNAGTWSAWVQILGGVAASGTELTASKRSNGNVSLACIGQNGHMYTAEGTFGSWSGWWDRQDAGSAPLTQIGSAYRDASNSDYVTVAADGKVYHRTYNTSTGWTAWTQIGTNIMGAGRRVALVSRSSTTLNAVVVGTDRKVYSATFSSASGWSAWSAVPGFTAGFDAQVGAVARTSTDVEIHIAAAGQVYTDSWSSATGWKGWHMLPANL